MKALTSYGLLTLALLTSIVAKGESAIEYPTHLAAPQVVGGSGLQVSDSTADTAYILRPGDKLEFQLRNTGYRVDKVLTIDNEGKINIEYLDWVKVAGMTIGDAEKDIRKKYEDGYFKQVNLRLSISEKAKVRFIILGQVQNPGFYEVPAGIRLDLLDAIAVAGGYTRIAGKITFKRFVDGQETEEHYSLKQLTRSKIKEIPVIRGNEKIIVGESLF